MRLLLATLAVLSLVLAACSSDGGDSPAVGSPASTDANVASTADDGPTAPDAVSEATASETSNPKDEAGLDLTDEAAGEQTVGAESPPAGPAAPPTEGLPGGRYVQIDGITAVGQGYEAAFTPFNYVPLIGSGPDDFHVHFFWNDVAPENAGTNGPAPASWDLYDGPSPFTGFTFANRPPAATQMCALVADANHGVTVGSGNCVTLP